MPSLRDREAEDGFAVDRSKASGHKSHCRACDRRRGRAYHTAHRDELHADRKAAREAAWQAELEAMVPEHRKRAKAAKKLHAAQVRHQKEFLKSLGVPDLSPEEGHREGPTPGLGGRRTLGGQRFRKRPSKSTPTESPRVREIPRQIHDDGEPSIRPVTSGVTIEPV